MPTVPTPSRLKRYFSVIARWFSITIVVFAITLWTGNYITENLLTKTYTATAEIEFHVNVMIPGLSLSNEHSDPQSEIQILESNDLLYPVIENLGLDKTWAKHIDKSDKDPLPMPDALAHLRKILKIEQVGNTNVIKIIASSDDPTEAADIANAIVVRYKANRDLDEDQRMTRGMQVLREQIGEQQKTVEEKQTALGKIKNVWSPAYADAQRELQKQQSMLEALNLRLKQIEADIKVTPSPVRIISRATVPESPTSPDKAFCMFVTVGVAALISVAMGCFVEVILLFVRAADGEHS